MVQWNEQELENLSESMLAQAAPIFETIGPVYGSFTVNDNDTVWYGAPFGEDPSPLQASIAMEAEIRDGGEYAVFQTGTYKGRPFVQGGWGSPLQSAFVALWVRESDKEFWTSEFEGGRYYRY